MSTAHLLPTSDGGFSGHCTICGNTNLLYAKRSARFSHLCKHIRVLGLHFDEPCREFPDGRTTMEVLFSETPLGGAS